MGRRRAAAIAIVLVGCGSTPPPAPIAPVAPVGVVSAAPASHPELDAGPHWTVPEGTDPVLAAAALSWIDGTDVLPDPVGRVGCFVRVQALGSESTIQYGLVEPPCEAPGSPDAITLRGVRVPILAVDRAAPPLGPYVHGLLAVDDLGSVDSPALTLLLVRLGTPDAALEHARATVRYRHVSIAARLDRVAEELAAANVQQALVSWEAGDLPAAHAHAARARAALARHEPDTDHARWLAGQMSAILDAIEATHEAVAPAAAAAAIAAQDPTALAASLGDVRQADLEALRSWTMRAPGALMPLLLAARDRRDLSRWIDPFTHRTDAPSFPDAHTVGEVASVLVSGCLGGLEVDAPPPEELYTHYFSTCGVQGLRAVLDDPSAGPRLWAAASDALADLGPPDGAGPSIAARLGDLAASGAPLDTRCDVWRAGTRVDATALRAATRELSRACLAADCWCRESLASLRLEAHDRDVLAEYLAWIDGHPLTPREATGIGVLWLQPSPPPVRRWIAQLVARAAHDPLADAWLASAVYGGHALGVPAVRAHVLAALADPAPVGQPASPAPEPAAGALVTADGALLTLPFPVCDEGPTRRLDLWAEAVVAASRGSSPPLLAPDVDWDVHASPTQRDEDAAAIRDAFRRHRW